MEKFKKTQKLILGLIVAHWILTPVKYFFTFVSVTIIGKKFFFDPVSFSELGPVVLTILIVSPLLWIIPFLGIMRKTKWGAFLAIIFAIRLFFGTISGFDNIDYSIYLSIISLIEIIIGLLLFIFSIIFLKRFPKEETNKVV
jgi:uncharacterized membrane protein